MAEMIRRIVRRAFRRTGFQRRMAPSFVEVMQHHAIDVVLDVGANDGDYGREIRDEGYTGRIVSFEPNPEAFARLQTSVARDPMWDAYQLGLGDVAGDLPLSVANADVFSSFKPLSAFGARSHHAAAKSVTTVPVVRLDDFLAERRSLLGRAYLKIDTQGFEMEVLRGAGEQLGQLVAIQAELPLIKTYRDEDNWLDVILWLRQHGFELATAVCNSRVGAQAREFDFVFVKRPKDSVS